MCLCLAHVITNTEGEMYNRNFLLGRMVTVCWKCAVSFFVGLVLFPTIVGAEVFRGDNSAFTVTLPDGFKKIGSRPTNDGTGDLASVGNQTAYSSDELPIRVQTLSEAYVTVNSPSVTFDIRKACTLRMDGIEGEGSQIVKHEMRNGSCYIQAVSESGRFYYWRIVVSKNKKAIYKIVVETFPTSSQTLNQYENIAKTIIESLTLRTK